MEDAAIVELYWDRDQRAITASDEKYGALCRSLSHNILASREDAEECVNDTWLRAWNAMPPQRPGILSAFFGKLTRNLSLDRWRRDRAAKRGGSQTEAALHELEDCLPDRHGPEEHLEARETAALISAFLRGEPELDRRLFVLRYFDLESAAALASRFGLTQGQVKARLHRTRCRLKRALEQEGVAL